MIQLISINFLFNFDFKTPIDFLFKSNTKVVRGYLRPKIRVLPSQHYLPKDHLLDFLLVLNIQLSLTY